MLSCSIWFSAPSFWMGGGLESRCVGRVYGADGAVRPAIYFMRKMHGQTTLMHSTINVYVSQVVPSLHKLRPQSCKHLFFFHTC